MSKLIRKYYFHLKELLFLVKKTLQNWWSPWFCVLKMCPKLYKTLSEVTSPDYHLMKKSPPSWRRCKVEQPEISSTHPSIQPSSFCCFTSFSCANKEEKDGKKSFRYQQIHRLVEYVKITVFRVLVKNIRQVLIFYLAQLLRISNSYEMYFKRGIIIA